RPRNQWPTWAVLILPQIEQQSIYRKWDLTLRFNEQPARSPVGGPYLPDDPCPYNIKTYFCPGRRSTDVGFSVNDRPDPAAAEPTPDSTLPARPGGLSDYASCGGSDNANGAMMIGDNPSGRLPDGSTQPPPGVNWAHAPIGTRLLSWKGQTTLSTIPDGTSNTLLVGEKHIRPNSREGKNEDRSVFGF